MARDGAKWAAQWLQLKSRMSRSSGNSRALCKTKRWGKASEVWQPRWHLARRWEMSAPFSRSHRSTDVRRKYTKKREGKPQKGDWRTKVPHTLEKQWGNNLQFTLSLTLSHSDTHTHCLLYTSPLMCAHTHSSIHFTVSFAYVWRGLFYVYYNTDCLSSSCNKSKTFNILYKCCIRVQKRVF